MSDLSTAPLLPRPAPPVSPWARRTDVEDSGVDYPFMPPSALPDYGAVAMRALDGNSTQRSSSRGDRWTLGGFEMGDVRERILRVRAPVLARSPQYATARGTRTMQIFAVFVGGCCLVLLIAFGAFEIPRFEASRAVHHRVHHPRHHTQGKVPEIAHEPELHKCCSSSDTDSELLPPAPPDTDRTLALQVADAFRQSGGELRPKPAVAGYPMASLPREHPREPTSFFPETCGCRAGRDRRERDATHLQGRHLFQCDAVDSVCAELDMA
jgi:hypothetical protein